MITVNKLNLFIQYSFYYYYYYYFFKGNSSFSNKISKNCITYTS